MSGEPDQEVSEETTPDDQDTAVANGQDEVDADSDGGDDADSASEVDGECVPDCSRGEAGEGPVCGPDGCGGYCEVCRITPPFAHRGTWAQQRWTLCDNASRSCIEPEKDCHDGWCRIPAASFLMGAVNGVAYFSWLQHPVTLTRSFEIMATEVTQARWEEVMDDNPSPHPNCGPDCPANGMTWFDAATFANRMSEAASLPPCYELTGCEQDPEGHGRDCERATFAGPDCPGYRLPSAAEWELAATTGADTCYINGHNDLFQADCWGPRVEEAAWFCGNAEADYGDCTYPDCSDSGSAYDPERGVVCCGPQPVGRKLENRFGLYDVMGNVEEFTGTVWRSADDSYPNHTPEDYTGTPRVDPGFDERIRPLQTPEGEVAVVSKGGDFASSQNGVCLGNRRRATPWADPSSWKYGTLGVRLVRTLKAGDEPGRPPVVEE